MKSNIRAMLFSLLPVALLLSACGPSTVRLNSSMTEYEYSPPEWKVPAGSTVELTLNNEGAIFHNWVLMPPVTEVEPPYDRAEQQQLLAEFRVRGGENETFTFTAPSTPGEYPVICSEGGHYELGMVGVLIVE